MSVRISRRQILAAGGAAAVAGALGGCGSAGRHTLTIMGSHPAEITDQDIAEFEQAHPDVKVKIVAVDTTVLTAMFAADSPPDIVRDQGVNNTPYVVGRDLAENLDPYVAKSDLLADSKLAKANDVWRYDGRQQGVGPRYGLVKDYSQDAMFWCNTNAFQAQNVDLPSTSVPISYDEWLDLAGQLTRRKGAQYQLYGLAPPFEVSLSAGLLNMVMSAGGSIFSEDFSAVDFSSAEARAALQWYVKYAAAGVGPTVSRALPAGGYPTFSADKLAMVGFGYWLSGQIAGDAKLQDHVTFMPAPHFGSTRTSPCFAGTGHWIPKRSKNKAAAWAFFEHYFGGKPAERRAQSGWGLPGIESMTDQLPNDKPYQHESLQVQQDELEHFSVLQYSPYVSYTALDAALAKELRKGLESGLSVGKLADAVNGTLNPLLQLGKDLIT